MGSIIFDPKVLIDSLSETAGYKAGLALSLNNIYEHFEDTKFIDLLKLSETQMIRIRAEEYEALFYKLLYKIGFTKEEYNGDVLGIHLYLKYKDTEHLDIYVGVLDLYNEILPKQLDIAIDSGRKSVDPSPFIEACIEKYGQIGMEIGLEKLESLNKGLSLSPSSGIRYTEWNNELELDSLFKNSTDKDLHGVYFDQRYIDYLSQNTNKLEDVHWRKFEKLTAEYFERLGYQVELGPGQNDDGVDVRVWKESQDTETEAPHLIIQCKRVKKKVEKVIVKGLYSDVLYENADYGLVVTSSELSPGARNTIITRGYPIKEINKDNLKKWLKELRTPGNGIIRV